MKHSRLLFVIILLGALLLLTYYFSSTHTKLTYELQKIEIKHNQNGEVDTNLLSLEDKKITDSVVSIIKEQIQQQGSIAQANYLDFELIMNEMDTIILSKNSPYVVLIYTLPKSIPEYQYIVVDLNNKKVTDTFLIWCPILETDKIIDTHYSPHYKGEVAYYYVYGTPKSIKIKNSLLEGNYTYNTNYLEACEEVVSTTSSSVTVSVFLATDGENYLADYKKIGERVFLVK